MNLLAFYASIFVTCTSLCKLHTCIIKSTPCIKGQQQQTAIMSITLPKYVYSISEKNTPIVIVVNNVSSDTIRISDPKLTLSTKFTLTNGEEYISQLKIKNKNVKNNLITIPPKGVYKTNYSYSLQSCFSILTLGTHELRAVYNGHIIVGSEKLRKDIELNSKTIFIVK